MNIKQSLRKAFGLGHIFPLGLYLLIFMPINLYYIPYTIHYYGDNQLNRYYVFYSFIDAGLCFYYSLIILYFIGYDYRHNIYEHFKVYKGNKYIISKFINLIILFVGIQWALIIYGFCVNKDALFKDLIWVILSTIPTWLFLFTFVFITTNIFKEVLKPLLLLVGIFGLDYVSKGFILRKYSLFINGFYPELQHYLYPYFSHEVVFNRILYIALTLFLYIFWVVYDKIKQ